MTIQPIGKNLFRLTVKSDTKRARLAKIPGVVISENRVIFPGEYCNQIQQLLTRTPKTKEPQPIQLNLF